MIENTLRLLRPAIREMQAYRSARSLGIEGKIFLDANESPWAPAGHSEINRYPEPQPGRLVKALADLYSVVPQQLLIGRGADDAIDVLVRSFCEAGKDSILICPPTYGVYEVAANIQGAEVVRIPVKEESGFAVDGAAVVAAVTPATKLVFLCSPNNPTGNVVSGETVEAIAKAIDGKAILVLDEAYIEFSVTPSFVSRLSDYPNVVVLRTLSKAWALAGARCGTAIGHPGLIQVLQKVRAPYPVSTPATSVVMSVLNERGKTACENRIACLLDNRNELVAQLAGNPLVEKVFPSDANFVLIKTRDSKELIRRCLERGIVVRDRSPEPGLENCVRVTVGSSEENLAFLQAISGQPSLDKPLARKATVIRKTKETSIVASVDLDGEGAANIDTGIKYFDHMLEQISKHGGFDLKVEVAGDLEVDEHHTVEDTALVLGECLNKALGDRRGIGRYGFLLPMDEAEAKVSIDLSGRPYLVFKGQFSREYVGELPTELVSHFFRSLSDSLRATLHIEVSGENAHHMVEACFKAVGRSLRQAIARDGSNVLPSTKGLL